MSLISLNMIFNHYEMKAHLATIFPLHMSGNINLRAQVAINGFLKIVLIEVSCN